jgi:hypothetical protein
VQANETREHPESILASPPDLESPGTDRSYDPEVIEANTPTFEWEDVSGADGYGLYVSEYDDGEWNLIVDEEDISSFSTSYDDVTLEAGKKYRWNMRTYEDGRWSTFSERLYFQVEASAPSPPELDSPGNDDSPGPELSDTEQTFQWNEVSGADKYGLYVRDLTTDDLVVDDDNVSSFSDSQSETLTAGHEYRWNMRTYENGQWSEFSEPFYFQIEGAAPSPACPENPGANPAPETISDCIDDLAEQYKVPGIIIRALLQQENGAWDNTIESGDGGIGLTQITIKDENKSGGVWYVSLASEPEEGNEQGRNDFTTVIEDDQINLDRLRNNWVFNLETGVRLLLTKKAFASREPGADNKIIENWYNALAFYNGYSAYNSNTTTISEYCPQDPNVSIGSKCGNDPGFPYLRDGETYGWSNKQFFPYQEAVFNALSQPQRYNFSDRAQKGFPDQAVSITLPGPRSVGEAAAGGYDYVWGSYSKNEGDRGSKWLDFYVENGQGYARKSTDCGSDATFDQIPSDCVWSTPKKVAIHWVSEFSDRSANAVGGSPQRMALNNVEGANLISFAEDPSAATIAELSVSSQTGTAGASGVSTSEASAAGSLSEYVFWLGDDGMIEYGRISEVDPVAKRGYFVFVDGDAPVTISYSGDAVDPDLGLHRTMNMSGPTRSTTFASNESVYPDAFYVEGGEVLALDPRREALNPGTAYFLAAAEETTFSPEAASTTDRPAASSASLPDTTGQHARRAKIEHLLDRVNAKFAALRDTPAAEDSTLQAASSASAAPASCDADAATAFAVCLEVDQEVSLDDPPLPFRLEAETASGATDGWEDESDVVQVEFSTPGLPHAYIDEGYGLQTSVKSSDGDTQTWPLLVQSASELPNGDGNTNDVQLSWNVDRLPDGRTVRLLDDGGNVVVNDMTEQTQLSFDVDDPSTQWRFELELLDSDQVPNEPVAEKMDETYTLSTVAPNPFSSRASFTLAVRETQDVRVVVYDVLGRRVALLHEGPLAAQQTKRFTLSGDAWADGVYLVQVEGELFRAVRRMTLAK